MKYSDRQRVEKIRETTEKLLRYVETAHITPDQDICRRADPMGSHNAAV